MRSKSDLRNPSDLLDDSWGSATEFLFLSGKPGSSAVTTAGAAPPIDPTPLVLPADSVEAQAAQNGSGGPGSVVAVTSGSGLTINLIFDAAAMAAPASFRTGIQQAVGLLSSAISDK